MDGEQKVSTGGVDPEYVQQGHGAPMPINPATGQHKAYWVLSEEERSKGFVRPVRETYRHVGAPGPKYETRPLTADEHVRYDEFHYVLFEAYPEELQIGLGRFWRTEDLDRINKGCGSVTTMSRDISETYARKPTFYGSTFCCGCAAHFPVGLQGEFVWDGTDERVGV